MAPLQREDHQFLNHNAPENASSSFEIAENESVSASTRSDMSVSLEASKSSEASGAEAMKPMMKQKKSVRISEFSELYVVPRFEYDLEESFYTDEDYDRIQRENEKTLYYMQQGIYHDDSELCFRGLEGSMIQYHLEKRHLVATTVFVVLERQKEKKTIDPAWVEQYYSRITSYSAMNAHRIALWDAKVAQELEIEVKR
mmetsp:Transcript_11786/g.21781  ORF Transcript_11786/g.21781 Transcript_11786/m.21781 type:complete len:199 (+) Transcript_11786:320-916(+)